MNIATQISEAIAAKREHQTAIDNLDVRIAQLVASIPEPVDMGAISAKIDAAIDALRTVQDGVEDHKNTAAGIEDDAKDIALRAKDLKRELDSLEDTCGDAVASLEMIVKNAERWSSDPAA